MSVVIPAHNEAAVIARCLHALLDGVPTGELEVTVVCNGCADDTAAIARGFKGVTVVELPMASKVKALREGDRHTTVFPRVYLDGDIELPPETWRELFQALRRVPCAAPSPEFQVTGRSWAIRSFYSVWRELPYWRGNAVGSGVYGLSEQGRARFGEFPDLTADDQFVMQLFESHERETLRSRTFTIHTPRTLRGLVRMRTRVYRGNRELARSGLARTAPPTGGRSMTIARLARSPRRLPEVLCYLSINTVAKALASRPSRGWERDDSARQNSSNV